MLTFRDFDAQTVNTRGGVFQLFESITHIEDLPPHEFLDAVKNIANLIATEKLDGANLIAGLDKNGDFYTSREAKGGTRHYKNYSPERASDNGFVAAHTALNDVQDSLKSVLDPGDAVECEILFGRQPNAIVYGSNYIAFLRMVPGDSNEHPNEDKLQRLTAELQGKTITVELSMISTIDGEELITKDERVTFKFVAPAVIDNFEFHKVDVKKELHEFEVWLHQHPPSSFRTKAAFVEAASQFTLPIKEKLVDGVLRRLKPAYRDTEVEPSEDIGVEGIVVRDPKTGKQFKIVDKSVFSIINQFNYAIRNEIKQTFRFNPETGRHLYKEFNASTGVNGSIYDEMLRQIAQAVGIPGLSSYMGITRTIKSYGSLDKFIRAFPQDVNSLRSHIAHAVNSGLQHLGESKKHFEQHWKTYTLKLGNGREITYSKEVYNRTLLSYAEAFKELTEILRQVQNSRTVAEIANALFGKQLKTIR